MKRTLHQQIKLWIRPNNSGRTQTKGLWFQGVGCAGRVSGMSLSRSVGDLVPQDIAEILARERHSGKGRKHRGGSLGRAFRWLKARRKKKGGASGGSNSHAPIRLAGIVGDGHHHGHDNAKGLPKQQEERPTLSPLYPENVFIEGNRPQYLQDLHTEAQEGLKIQLQEENGMDYESITTMSVTSTATMQTEDGDSLADSMRAVGSGGTDAMSTVSMSAVSTVSTVSAVSDVSAMSAASTQSLRSTRSGLTRQGSTFKPLSGSRRPEKRRRSKRSTVAGIPQHVQRELGLDRGPWHTSPTEAQLPNGEGVVMLTEEVDALPDPGGTPEGVREHLAALEVLESSEEQQLLRHHMQSLYRDDLAIARSAGPRLSPGRRPKSVSVPRRVAGRSEGCAPSGSPTEALPSSPVMYISPQATYLSKIIPNAVLPGEVDVIEISRKGRSRGSVRTLSKSSLTAPSPALSRASVDWSGSDSSHTVVSDSSTISSGGGRGRRAKAERERAVPHPASPDQMSIHSSVSCSSDITSVSQQMDRYGDDRHSDGPFRRNLSVTKSKKNPPAPPRRTNSLHPSKQRRRSRELLDAPVPSPSPAYSADQSEISSSSSSSSTVAPTPAQPVGAQTLSPSSGYSSQSPASPPQPSPTGPAQQGAPPKTSFLTAAVLDFGTPLDIPPPPIVKAPTPPPPETWIHDQRSFDLLCGPLSVQRNLFVALQKIRLERQRKVLEQPQCPLVAGGEPSAAGQKKYPPPVRKKSALIRASPAVMLKKSQNMQMLSQTPPPSPPPSHQPPPPTKPTPPSSVSELDSAWPLPPPPAVELLVGSVFDGQNEPDFLPPPPLQGGAGSPPIAGKGPPVGTTLLETARAVTTVTTVTAPPVTVESVPPAARTQQASQEVTAPAAIVTAAVVTEPNDIAKPVEERTLPTCPAEPGPANQEAPSREPQPKISPTAKQEVRVPLTAQSLLQRIRKRASDTAVTPAQDSVEKPGQNQKQADEQSAPQRPKTLTVTAPPPTVKSPPPATGSAPSMRLQEAIRMKTAAMSRLGPRPTRSPSPSPSPSSPSPASTASFIFAKSTKKVVIETPSSPEAQAGLKANLASELAWIAAAQKKPAKVPPPVAKKPSQHTPTDHTPPTTPDGLPAMVAENGGVTAPRKETPTEQAQPKENPQSLTANPGGAQPASTGQVSLSPPS
ncbi:hypothetical protein SKAU_G00420880 [Synaphobranchus kaupii]|uniref:KIAA1522 n=1 Tax=Synaphobranchus kaupii TaxID=118154 RepID=A0A9Q1E6M5_SYNKA|nr:hypothetical protein SKAU_G00420880 [Synaphobranchus kaupii]